MRVSVSVAAAARAALAVVALAVHPGATGPALAQGTFPGRLLPVWEPNGPVSALAIDGHTLYVGGTFDHVGPLTGAFATVDAADANAFTTGAQIDAHVNAVVADGAGGWFALTLELSGSFATFRSSIEHVLPTGENDPAWTRPSFTPATDVFPMVLEGGRLFVAGGFTAINGTPRAGLAALDPATGALLPWNANLTWAGQDPAVRFRVRSLAASPGRLYVSGNFDHVGAAPRNKFAVIDSATGTALPPLLPTPVADPIVDTIVVSGSRLYLHGGCQAVSLVLCAYDLDLVPLPGWTFPSADGPMAASPTGLFASHRTFAFPGSTRTVKLDPETGALLPWPEIVTTAGGPAQTLTVAGNRLYIGGYFTAINGQPRNRLASVDATTGTLDAWAPLVGGGVVALATTGNAVAFGGAFTSVGGIKKRNLVAIDLLSARPAMPLPPDMPSPVTALLKVGDVMVVGSAEQPNGPSRTGPELTAFSTRTGAPLPWSLTSDGRINAMAADAHRLYVAGQFSSLSGVARQHVGAVDLATGALTAWNPSPNGEVTALAVSNGTLFAAGHFTVVPGYGRSGGVAWDLASGDVLSFNPSIRPGFTPKAFAFHQSRVLLVGERDTSGTSRDSFEWVDRVSGAAVSPATDAAVNAAGAAQVDDTIFVVNRMGTYPNTLAVVNAPTGAVQLWDSVLLGDGQSIAASPGYAALGGGALSPPASTRNLTVFAAPAPGAPQHLSALVAGPTLTLGWRSGPPPSATSFHVEAGTSAGATDIGVFPVGTATGVSGALPPGTYYTRVRGVGASGPGAASSEAIVTVPSPPTPPSAPGTLSASVAAGVVTLSWGAAAGNATTYVVEAGTATGLANIGTVATGHLDTTFVTSAPGGTYWVRVRAANAFGPSPSSNEVVVVVP